jgi:TonB family protein
VYLHPSRRSFLLSLVAVGLSRKISPAAAFFPHVDSQKTEDKSTDNKSDDHVYEPGGDVKPPKLVHYVEPEFSPSSKEAYVEGTVKISTVVTTDGKPTECRIASGLSTEEDRTALEALKQWVFQPGTKADKPVKVRITVEIDFHLL